MAVMAGVSWLGWQTTQGDGLSHRLVPVDGLAEAGIELCSRAEGEFAFGSGYVEAAARLAVGLGGVPDDAATATGEAGDGGGEVADAALHAAGEIAGRGV